MPLREDPCGGQEFLTALWMVVDKLEIYFVPSNYIVPLCGYIGFELNFSFQEKVLSEVIVFYLVWLITPGDLIFRTNYRLASITFVHLCSHRMVCLLIEGGIYNITGGSILLYAIQKNERCRRIIGDHRCCSIYVLVIP